MWNSFTPWFFIIFEEKFCLWRDTDTKYDVFLKNQGNMHSILPVHLFEGDMFRITILSDYFLWWVQKLKTKCCGMCLVFYLPYFYFCFCNFHSSITQAAKRSMWKILMAFVGADSCNVARSQWGYLTPSIGAISEVVLLSMPYWMELLKLQTLEWDMHTQVHEMHAFSVRSLIKAVDKQNETTYWRILRLKAASKYSVTRK